MNATKYYKLKLNNLKNEYKEYSDLIFNFQLHIDRLVNDNIISPKDKNFKLKELFNIMINLNKIYNEAFDNIKNTNFKLSKNKLLGNQLIEINFLSCIQKMTKIKNNNIFQMKKFYDDSFINIKENLLELGLFIGFYSIKDSLKIIIGNYYENLLMPIHTQKIEFYNKCFIITNYKIIINNDNNNLLICPAESTYELLMKNFGQIHIPYFNKKIILSGYICYDNTNILYKTAQICFPPLYKKIKSIKNIFKNNSEIPHDFVRLWLRHSMLYDLLLNNKEELINKIKNEYVKYEKIKNSSYNGIYNEFTKNNLLEIYTIIKLVLIFNDKINDSDNILNILNTNKKINIDHMIIYKNLSNILQLKWKTSLHDLKDDTGFLKSSKPNADLYNQIILHKTMPDKVKSCAIDKIEEMKSQNSDYHKQLLYVKKLLDFPWNDQEDDDVFKKLNKNHKKAREFLDNARKRLDERVFGHDQCKDTIIELISKWISNPAGAGTAIGLVGPPGVGKTLLAKGLGIALGIPFAQISLGGQNDSGKLYGYEYTYASARPGMIIDKMCGLKTNNQKSGQSRVEDNPKGPSRVEDNPKGQSESNNEPKASSRCVLYFDELDKVSRKGDTNEIFSVLIHLTDPNTNSEFQDRFFQEIEFPLNKTVFVMSYNDADKLDPILAERITQIEIKPYSTNDKIKIVQNFTLKEVSEMVGIEHGKITIKKRAIKYLIENYTNEAGVRELKRKLEKIFLKINLDKIYQRGIFEYKQKYIEIDIDDIHNYLQKPLIDIEQVHDADLTGVVNGLYATASGKGGIIPIQIYSNKTGSEELFTLRLTGCQGDVMKESVLCALTVAVHTVRDHISSNITQLFPFGFHIHAPNASTTKNGPSAGAAFAIGFISRILNIPIRYNVALTGEIDLVGDIKKIGGLSYKLTGAKKAGVTHVLIPRENKEDLDKIIIDMPELFKKNFKISLVDNIKDVCMKILLVDDNCNINDYLN
jgi:ATP-dependent Lon protease